VRFPVFRLLLAATAAAALTVTAVRAQQPPATHAVARAVVPAGLPAWVVPVLRLVSATHVEPTTGVVLSADGLVLVPNDFARIGDEIIVLDGGTDIIRHGRPARFERSFPELGLKVLAVEGLKRRAAPVAALPLADGGTVTLTAFPPAEDIAEGTPPVVRSATVSVSAGNAEPVISPDPGSGPGSGPDSGSGLPNVTGPLLVIASFGVADAIITEAGLSLLGLGIRPPEASWGQMLTISMELAVVAAKPWMWIAPAACIALAVLSINFIGDGLRDALDPRIRGR
jgi:hypothetical protein